MQRDGEHTSTDQPGERSFVRKGAGNYIIDHASSVQITVGGVCCNISVGSRATKNNVTGVVHRQDEHRADGCRVLVRLECTAK